MIISSPSDYREAARRRLPPFLFHYIDGGANAEYTLGRNVSDLSEIELRQRVLKNVESLDISTELFGRKMAMPVALSPVGLTGMYARRGEVQAAPRRHLAQHPLHALHGLGLPDRRGAEGDVRADLVPALCAQGSWIYEKRAGTRHGAGIETLVFTVDMPTPGSRYRDAHSGMSGPNAAFRRMVQAVLHPHWAFDVGLFGRPHDLGNISAYRGQPTKLEDYIGWLAIISIRQSPGAISNGSATSGKVRC